MWFFGGLGLQDFVLELAEFELGGIDDGDAFSRGEVFDLLKDLAAFLCKTTFGGSSVFLGTGSSFLRRGSSTECPISLEVGALFFERGSLFDGSVDLPNPLIGSKVTALGGLEFLGY